MRYNLRMSLRDRIRRWLGTESVADIVLFKAMEQTQKRRHDELGELIRTQNAEIQRLNQILTSAHLAAPRRDAIRVVDWETLQAEALESLMKEEGK